MSLFLFISVCVISVIVNIVVVFLHIYISFITFVYNTSFIVLLLIILSGNGELNSGPLH